MSVLDQLMDMNRGQIMVVGITAALYLSLPFILCLFFQPLAVIIFYKNRNEFTTTGIPQAMMLIVAAKTMLVITRVIINCLVLFAINLTVFVAWRRLCEQG